MRGCRCQVGGDEAASALLEVRASVDSEAKPGWGEIVTGYTASQLHRAEANR
ncbi:hypothetical protein [Lipingzhangella rawalii]|uniref:hypothetical protein n=1 Tax=Lipingzhangella rawalii TaxID=2055835 RepID=UPI00287B5F24|nr:hypothetical protein [Lipingzhangella rawalii]